MSTPEQMADRLEAVLARLERLGGISLSPSPLAAVDNAGWPLHVAPGELIESAWGNSVVTKLKTGPTHAYASGIGAPSAAGATNVLSVPLGLAPVTTYMTMWATLLVGGQDVGDAAVDVVLNHGGSVLGQNDHINGGARYTTFGFVWKWVVPEGSDMGFYFRCTPSSNQWVTTSCLYWMHAQDI